jgi:hypothetical protein
VDLGQGGLVHAGGLGPGCPQVAEQALAGVGVVAGAAIEGGGLELGQDLGQAFGAHRPLGSGHRPIHVGDDGQGDQGVGQVAVEPVLGRGRAAPAQVVHRHLAGVGDHHGGRADRSVGHPGPPEPLHGGEGGVHHRVGDLVGGQGADRTPAGRAAHQDRVTGLGALAGHHHLAGGHAGLVGQRQVGLVLDLLDPVDGQARAGVAVPEHSPELAEGLGVAGITAVQRDLHRTTARLGAHVAGHPPLLVRHGDHGLERGAQVAHHLDHVGGGGQPGRRAQRQVDGGGQAPAQHQAGRDVEGQPGPAEHRRGGAGRQQHPHQPVHRPAQIGQDHQGDGHGRRQPGQREAGADAGQRRLGGSPGVGADNRRDQAAQGPGPEPGQRRLHQQPSAPGQQRQHHQDHGDPERPDEPQGVDQPLEAFGGRDQGVDHMVVDGGAHPDGSHDQGEDHHGQHQPDHIGGSAAHPAVAPGHEHGRLPAGAEPAPAGARQRPDPGRRLVPGSGRR